MSPTTRSAARAGLWLLPGYGVLLGVSTLTHQPPTEQFDAYARYVTTDVFLASHLGASILGAAFGVLGVVAVAAHLVRGPAARAAITGLVLTVVSAVLMSAAFGSAAFVQPGIGRAHLAGVPGMPELNADTAYGPALFATIGVSVLVYTAAAVAVGWALARTGLRWYGVGYAVLLPLFVVTGQTVQVLQPVTGFAFAALTAALAVRLPRVTAAEPTTAAPVDVHS
jgi:hypothetical protein